MANIHVHAVHTAFELQSDRHRTHTYTQLMFRICGSDNIFSMATSSQSTFSVLLVLARAMFCLILSHSHTCHICGQLATINTSLVKQLIFLSFIIRCIHGNRHHYTHILFILYGPFLFIKVIFNGLSYAIHIFDTIATLH